MKKAFKRLNDAMERGDKITGVPTGFVRYDAKTAGLHEGDLTIVAARPGMGKTSWVLNVAANIAAPRSREMENDPNQRWEEAGVGVVVFSLEMPREQLANRMVCAEARVDVSKMRTGHLGPQDWSKLTQAASFLGALPIWIDDSPGLSIIELRAKVRRLQSEYDTRDEDGRKVRKIGAVIIDYLQLMKGRDGVQSREQEISEISRGLKGLAKELEVPVIALSQLNRAVETRSEKSKRPLISDLRESGAIEQDADNIVFIYRDDYYNREDSAEPNVAELIIAKQRNGPTGTAKVRFDRQWTRFDNLAEGEYEEEPE
jgi:replicative DNA helicase